MEALDNVKAKRPQAWVEALDNVKAMAVTKQVPHLRWSQAPPLPWRRPGSADIVGIWATHVGYSEG